jgi:hypothetical protein
MVAGVMETVHTEVSDCYQAIWLGEADEAPLIYPEAIAATRALGGLRRLWLKIDATPHEYLAWEEVMDRWLLPRSRDYGKLLVTLQLLSALIKQLQLGGSVYGMI